MIFRRTSVVIRDKIVTIDRDLAALASAIDDDPKADFAQAEVARLEQRREVLREALHAAEAEERHADADKGRKAAESVARAADQHAGAVRKAMVAVQTDIAALAAHWTDAKAALARLLSVIGDDPVAYPSLSVRDLAKAISGELFRATAVPGNLGDWSDLPGATSAPGVPANKMTPLGEIVDKATRHATGVFRARLGLTGEREAAPIAPEPFPHPQAAAEGIPT